MKLLPSTLILLMTLVGCKPQDPAPLPPEVGTRTVPAPAPAAPATAEPALAAANDAEPTSTSAGEAPGEVIADAAADPAVDGASVYLKACVTCHATGLAGAPKLDDHADWAPRIAQGDEVLFKHATEGFTGKKGMMPPRGGFTTLSDAEIRAAIEHMTAGVR
jgi:cytochrome c5